MIKMPDTQYCENCGMACYEWYLNKLRCAHCKHPTMIRRNLVILVPDKIRGEWSCFISDIIPDLSIVNPTQCFPLYYDDNYKPPIKEQPQEQQVLG